jgi:hypothetical protein
LTFFSSLVYSTQQVRASDRVVEWRTSAGDYLGT